MTTSRFDRLPPVDEAQRYTLLEAARYLRVSLRGLYRLIGAGEIVTFTSGRRRFVPGSEIARLSRAPQATAA